jgi:microcystin-dependent protein
MTSVLTFYETFTTTGTPTIGDTKTSITSTDHNGWLLCDGRLFPRSNYPFLFNAIGYTFGGSGNLFKLPDGRGRVVGHVNSSNVSLDMNGNPIPIHTFGSTTGEETHTLTIAEMPTHNHPGSSNTNNTVFSSANNNNTNIVNLTGSSANSGGTNVSISLVMSNQGGSNAHNIMQPTIFMGNMFVYSGVQNTPLLTILTPYIYN